MNNLGTRGDEQILSCEILEIILNEISNRENEIRTKLRDNGYKLPEDLTELVGHLNVNLNGNPVKNSYDSISLLKRMMLHPEISDIILRNFPELIFELIDDIFVEAKFTEYKIRKELYISRYLYLIITLINLPYLYDYFLPFWSLEEARSSELNIILSSISDLINEEIYNLNYERKNFILYYARNLTTIVLLWERILPMRNYLKTNNLIYVIMEQFLSNLDKINNKTIKYLFLRLYSDITQLNEKEKVELYRSNNLEEFFICIHLNQFDGISNKDDLDLYLQYLIFIQPPLNTFDLLFKNSLTLNKRVYGILCKPEDKIENSGSYNFDILDIYEQKEIDELIEVTISNILSCSPLIFFENIRNGLEIYYSLLNNIKTRCFEKYHNFNIIRLYLDYNIDSKSLLGNWVIGDNPGEFKWEYGILTKCLIKGDWLLVENIQDAPKDVIIKLNEISESIYKPTIDGIKNYTKSVDKLCFELDEFNQKITIHPNFRLFASCIVSKVKNERHFYYGSVSNIKDYINDIIKLLNVNKWKYCYIPTPTNVELKKAIKLKYNNLNIIENELLDCFENLNNVMNDQNYFNIDYSKSINIRKPSSNDFFKGLNAISNLYFKDNINYTECNYLNEKLRMKISLLIGSLLLDHIPLKNYRNKLQMQVSKSFGINNSESEHYIKNSKFDIHLINKSERSQSPSSISITNKGLNIDIMVNLNRNSSKEMFIGNIFKNNSSFSNYTFTSIHSQILYKIIISIYNNENILLVGDTGTGKTTIIQQLHYMLFGANKNIEAIRDIEDNVKCCELLIYNFNDQSESSDIIGSYRPINIYNEIKSLYDDYLLLLEKSNISRRKNVNILKYLLLLLNEKKWDKFINNLILIIDKVLNEFENLLKNERIELNSISIKNSDINENSGNIKNSDDVKKRSRMSVEEILSLKLYWRELKQKCQLKLKDERIFNEDHESKKHYFEFIDGILLKAIKEGHWLILDELNLASIDILQRLIPVLNRKGNNQNMRNEIEIFDNIDRKYENNCQSNNSCYKNIGYLVIPEKGDEEIKIHPRFRLFSCMNPTIIPIEQSDPNNAHFRESDNIKIKSTSGKKELPALIRSLFTEYFVDELSNRKDLEDIVYNYLRDVSLSNQINIALIVDIYLELKSLSNSHEITIGIENNKHGIPNYSLRTFTNCLNYIRNLLLLQNNWRQNQNKIKVIESTINYNKNGDSIIQNNILRMNVEDIIYNGVMMSFSTPLVNESYSKVDKLVRKILKIDQKSEIQRINDNLRMDCTLFSAPKVTSNGSLMERNVNINYLFINDYIINVGNNNRNFHINNNNDFVLTPYVIKNINVLLRILSGSRNPILIEGETSTGKTSLIKYISELTNHKFVRINNHEHTDTEEYFGKFVPNKQGDLEFIEGPLVNSIRNGYWLVLDELNLAPSEVLESLNRLLDNNREIYIPETGETIKAHEDFQLFATQNPAGGIYGGRKILSQAFRNRFIEIYFDEIPPKELEIIISKRCNIPISYSELMIKVYIELKRYRSTTQMFSGDFSFITVRDLLRWGNRLVSSKNDNVLDRKNLLIQGFYVIGERIRDHDEKIQLAEILFKICKSFDIKNVNEVVNYSTLNINNYLKKDEEMEDKEFKINREQLEEKKKKKRKKEIDKKNRIKTLNEIIVDENDYVLTSSFKRMLTLVNECIIYDEPVLLIGSTGCGKTSIFQLLSKLYKKRLYIVNCHQQIEASDMLGSLRPVRNKILRLNQELHNFTIEINNISSESPNKECIINIIRNITNILDNIQNENQKDLTIKKLSINNESRELLIKLQEALSNFVEFSDTTSFLLYEKLTEEIKLYIDEESNSLFEWQDGPVIKAMKTGSFLLLDEINLCDDSVIERLNSLLEDNAIGANSNYRIRTIHLTEKGGELSDNNDETVIGSHKDFRIFATMNPSGDYGKRELSPALRNRFNEIFVPNLSIYQLKEDIKVLILNKIIIKDYLNTEIDLIDKLSDCILMFSILYENDIKKDNILFLKEIDDFNKFSEKNSYFKSIIGSQIQMYIDNTYSLLMNDNDGNCIDVNEYTIRDILSWCHFINNNYKNISNYYLKYKNQILDYLKLNGISVNSLLKDEKLILDLLILSELYIQGANMLIIDGLSANNDKVETNIRLIYVNRLLGILYSILITPVFKDSKNIGEKIQNILIDRFQLNNGFNWIRTNGIVTNKEEKNSNSQELNNDANIFLNINKDEIQLGPFHIKRKSKNNKKMELREIDKVVINSEETYRELNFTFNNNTTLRNLSSIIRSMSILKPILLQGSPGIGKTAILLNLSRMAGVKLHRVNMSEQTDFSDLFGCEIPISNDLDSKNKLINWMDGILLYAMKNGDWIVLDELNLATQQILEGLNSIMDHRRNIYIPEIGQTIVCHESFRIFATQNPVKIGSSGRKGLPQSFLNRFIKINVGKLNSQDYFFICKSLFNNLSDEIISLSIKITQEIEHFNKNIRLIEDFNLWEWNLRDIIRLLNFVEFYMKKSLKNSFSEAQIMYNSLEVVYLSRLRNNRDYTDINNLVITELSKSIINSGSTVNIINIKNHILNNNRLFSIFDRNNNKSRLRNWNYENELVIDYDILPLNIKKFIIMITDSISLSENILLTCTECMEYIVKYIKLISKNIFNNIKVNEINILPSLDANDLIGSYQQYNDEVIYNEIIDLLMSIEIQVSNTDFVNKLKLKKLQNFILYSDKNFDFINEYIDFISTYFNKEDFISSTREDSILVESNHNTETIIQNRSILEKIRMKLDTLKRKNDIGPKFQYIFSTVINSIKNGEWLIINNIQNCSSALLDRLNSLLEDKENDLFIIESGVPQYIKRHENFRLFFINNHKIHNNFISNALINRCVEIFVDFSSNGESIKSTDENFEDNNFIQKQVYENILTQNGFNMFLNNLLKNIFTIFQITSCENFENTNKVKILLNFINVSLKCNQCKDRLIEYTIFNNKEYNRYVVDSLKFHSNNNNFSHDEIYQLILVSSILINAINDFIRISLNNYDQKVHCCFFNCQLFSLIKEQKSNIELINMIDKKLFMVWINCLFSNSIVKYIIKDIQNSSTHNLLKTSLNKAFKQLCFIDTDVDSIIIEFYLNIFEFIFNNFNKIREITSSYYQMNIKKINFQINQLYKENDIKTYNHMDENYKILHLLLLDNDENINTFLSINYIFNILIRSFINFENISENIIYLFNTTRLMSVDKKKTKFIYFNSILNDIINIYKLNINIGIDCNCETIDEDTNDILLMLNKFLPISNDKLLDSIFNVIFNPIMKLENESLMNILKTSNIFVYTLNKIFIHNGDHELLLKRYFYENFDSINLNSKYLKNLFEQLINYSIYFDIKYIKSFVLEIIKHLLAKLISNADFDQDAERFIFLLEVIDLLLNNLLKMDKFNNYECLTPKKLLLIFNKIYNQYYNIINLLKIELKNLGIYNFENNCINDGIIKIIHRDKTYLETIYNYNNYLGDGVIINKEYLILKDKMSETDNIFKIIDFLIHKKIDINNIINYFVQIKLCNLEFLDKLFIICSKRNKKTSNIDCNACDIWKQITNHINDFNNLISKEINFKEYSVNLNIDESFSTYYLYKQHLNCNIGLLLLNKLSRDQLLNYLNFLYTLYIDDKKKQYLILIASTIEFISIYDSYNFFIDYLDKKRSVKSVKNVQKNQFNNILYYLLESQINNESIEDHYIFKVENVNLGVLIKLIKESSIIQHRQDYQVSDNFIVEYEFLFKLLMKFDQKMLIILFLNDIYNEMVDIQLNDIISIDKKYLNLHYSFNNHSLINNDNNDHLKNIFGILLYNIFDYLNYIGVEVDSDISNSILEVSLVNRMEIGRENNQNKIRYIEYEIRSLIELLKEKKGDKLFVLIIEYFKNIIDFLKLDNIKENLALISMKTCILYISLPTNYHYKNLLYIDENKIHNEYKDKVNVKKQYFKNQIENNRLYYYHHEYPSKVHTEIVENIENILVLRSCDDEVDSTFSINNQDFSEEKFNNFELYLINSIDEIFSLLLDNELIKKFLEMEYKSDIINQKTLKSLENLIILIRNITNKTYFKLFNGSIRFMFNDITNQIKFALNSLLLSITIYIFNHVSIFDLVKDYQLSNNKISFVDELSNIIESYEYENITGLTYVNINNQNQENEKILKLWNSLLIIGEYIHDYNNEFLSMYSKFTQSFEYNSKKTTEDKQELQRDNDNYDHLIHKNDYIEKFIEKNHIMGEFDLINNLINTNNDTDNEINKKHKNIKLICLKILDIIIFKYNFQDYRSDIFVYNNQLKRYLLYNILYNDIKDFNNKNMWKFVLLYLNQFNNVDIYGDKTNNCHHIGVHLNKEKYENTVCCEYNKINNETVSIIDLIKKIKLVQKLNHMLDNVKILLLEYNDQPILIMIKDILDKILMISVNKLDIVTLICYLDVLLIRLIKWKEYIKDGLNLNLNVNKNLLIEHIDYIKYCIYESRKFQFYSWLDLINKIYQKYNYLSSFSFGNLLIIISKILNYEDFDNLLVYQELLDYLISSTIGEFPIRWLFIKYISSISEKLFDMKKESIKDFQNNTNNYFLLNCTYKSTLNHNFDLEKIKKLHKILTSIVELGNLIHMETIKYNSDNIEAIRKEIRDIINLSLWDIRDYEKAKKSILSIQKQLKKSLNKLDESLSITIDHFVSTNSSLYPKLSDFASEIKDELNYNEMKYVVKILSNSENSKMTQQRYYKTFIDLETYDLNKLHSVNNFNDFYFNNLNYYLNNNININMKNEQVEVINKCFTIINKLRINEKSKYNFQNINQSLINYNKLLSIGNTLLNNLICANNEYYLAIVSKFIVYHYLFNMTKDFDEHQDHFNNILSYINFEYDRNITLSVFNDNDNSLILYERNKITNYLNSLLRIYDQLNNILLLLSSSDNLKSCDEKIGFLLEDNNKHKSHKIKVINQIKDNIEIKLIVMISKLQSIFSIFNNEEFISMNYLIINNKIIQEISLFNEWISIELNNLFSNIENNMVNSDLFELYIIRDQLSDTKNYINLNNKIDINMDLEIVNIENILDLFELLIKNIKNRIDSSLLDNIISININIKEDFNKINEFKNQFVLNMVYKYNQLLNLSRNTIDYIKIMYLLLENNFFNICDRKEEIQNDDSNNNNVEWQGGCGFGNQESTDNSGKDISNELNNDDSLLEGLKGENNENNLNQSVDEKNKDAVDTEIDFNSKIEDFDNSNNNENNNEDSNEDNEIDRIFDDIDINDKKTNLEDCKKDESNNDSESRDHQENIETKNKGDHFENSNKDIVAKTDFNEKEEKENDDVTEPNENEFSNKNNEQYKENQDYINELNSEIDEIFEYEAKNFNPVNSDDNTDNDDNNEDHVHDENQVDFMDSSEHFSISDQSDHESTNEDSLNDGDNDNDNDSNNDNENNNSFDFNNTASDNEVTNVENQEVQKYENYDQKSNFDNNECNNSGDLVNSTNNKSKDKTEDEKNDINYEDYQQNDYNITDHNDHFNNDQNENSVNNNYDNNETKQETEENEEVENYTKNDSSDIKDKNQDHENNLETREQTKLVNPLFDENMENNENWYKKLKDLIINDQVEDSTRKFGNENQSEASYKIDNNLNNSNIQSLTSIQNSFDFNQENIQLEDDYQDKISHINLESNINHIENNNELNLDHKFIHQDNGIKTDNIDYEENENNTSDRNLNNLEYEYKDHSVNFIDGLYDNNDINENQDSYHIQNNFNDKNKIEERTLNECISIWKNIQNEISPIVNSLSNQLKIILEPTIRGKMEGNYKTGKKLSMKKVIAYIASDYRKDKMWLRRSKPSKREFNILMCIDNSHSMSISNNEYMALQSLFAIIHSLQKIEAGNFGVCSFAGDNIKQLINLTGQINNNDAINLLRHFNFKEESVDSHQNSIPNILRYSTDLLSSFSRSNNDKIHHQLIIIITDGRFNKNNVNVWINYAIQKRCIPVLVIIDNDKNGTSSIFNMKSVNKDDSGKMIVTPYLESFPFPYYSIIQNPKKLPNLLCELIKQWFELACK